MCGIAGIFNIVRQDNVSSEELYSNIELMTSALKHRGPDDMGIKILSHNLIALGHTRLSIIDISERGHQPMADASGRYWIVYNGEIYNYKELRPLLEQKYRFNSTSDTEVLLYGYMEWGADVLQKIKGMFAFAIWDSENQTLFLARDRVGEKPLIYCFWKGNFYFSSELNSLLKIGIERKINKIALLHYFNTGNSIPPPLTVYEGIYKLEQAHYLVVSKKGVKKEKYWALNSSDSIKISSARDIEDLFYDKLNDVVRRELVSDVPLGISLSGGVDSSSVCALAVEARKDIRTFSFVTTKPDDPEKKRIDFIVKLLKLNNKQYVFDENIPLHDLSNLSGDYGEPFAHFPHIYITFLYKKLREEVKTIITGNGGDEILAGYNKYQEIISDWKYNLLQSIGKKFISGECFWQDIMMANMRIGIRHRYDRFFTREFWRDISPDEIIKPYRHIFEKTKIDHFLNAQLLLDLFYYHYHGVVYLHDIASMKWGLELRSPFLDSDLIEFVNRLPVRYLIGDAKNPNFNKYILKKSMERKLPPELLYAKKMGFGYGVDIYDLIKNKWKKRIIESFSKKRDIDGWIDKNNTTINLWQRFESGELKNGLQIAALYVLYEWYDNYCV